MKKLTPKQERFCQEYAASNDLAESYRAAYSCKPGQNVKSCSNNGLRLLKFPQVKAKIKEIRLAAAERAEIKTEDVLRMWKAIATADVNDIIQCRRGCCRHCYGIDFAYQWTRAEYAEKSALMINIGKPVPENLGGFGFDANRPPSAYCQECHGLGEPSVFVADTRNLKGAAKLLYAGVKQTRNGVEIVLRDQDAALVNIAKYLGMFNEKPENDKKTPIPSSLSAIVTDVFEAAKIYQSIMSGS